MAQFIEFIPTEHASKVTDFVRIDDDLKCTVRVTDGTPTTSYYNFTGLEEGSTYQPQVAGSDDPNIGLVSVVKDGTDASSTIPVKMYYASTATGKDKPRAWLYSQMADTEKDAFNADDLLPSAPTQTFPIIVWNTAGLSGASLPAANSETLAPKPTLPRLYAILGSLDARRAYLKNKIRQHLDYPDLGTWVRAGTIGDTHTFANSGAGFTALTNSIARPQSFDIILEMWANLISVDANLADEQKFNLLNGDLGQPTRDLIERMDATVGTARIFAGNASRSAWTVRRFGSVAATTPWAYTAPTGDPWVSSDTNIAGLSLSSVGTGLDNWTNWVRS